MNPAPQQIQTASPRLLQRIALIVELCQEERQRRAEFKAKAREAQVALHQLRRVRARIGEVVCRRTKARPWNERFGLKVIVEPIAALLLGVMLAGAQTNQPPMPSVPPAKIEAIAPATAEVRLTWNAATNHSVSAYDVYYGTQDGQRTIYGRVTNTSAVLTLPYAARYYFAVASAQRVTNPNYPWLADGYSNQVLWEAPIPPPPVAKTNFTTAFVVKSTNLVSALVIWSQTVTNAPGKGEFFRLGMQSTNQPIGVVVVGKWLLVTNLP